jgi:hypothetical protein
MTSSSDPKRVLFIGQQPETVDFSDPALPPGFDAAKIHAGIQTGMQQMADRGWAADLCLVPPDASASETVKQRLAGTGYDAIVIGGGIRIPPKSLSLFERLVNAVHQGGPGAAIVQHDAAGHGRRRSALDRRRVGALPVVCGAGQPTDARRGHLLTEVENFGAMWQLHRSAPIRASNPRARISMTARPPLHDDRPRPAGMLCTQDVRAIDRRRRRVWLGRKIMKLLSTSSGRWRASGFR